MIEVQAKTRPRSARYLVGLEQDGVPNGICAIRWTNCGSWRIRPAQFVVDTVTQKLDKPTAPYYIGKGKAELIKDSFQTQQVTSFIFDNELSPAQGRNLEHLFNRKVLDRTQLILDIFAQRARSREGRLQIELAQLQYLLPRSDANVDAPLAADRWHRDARSGRNTVGSRSPPRAGTNREAGARVRKACAKFAACSERDVGGVKWPVAAVVGYTNAGKSTLLNLLPAPTSSRSIASSPLSTRRRAA